MPLPFALGRLRAFRPLRALVVPMNFSGAAVISVAAIEIIVVEKPVLLVFLHLFHLAVGVLEGFVHVSRPAHDRAEFDVVLLRDPAPAMTAGFERRDFLKALAGGRGQ